MDKKYIELFKNLAQTTAATAEQVMDYDREHGDNQGLETAIFMRDDFQELANRMNNDEYTLVKNDAAKLIVGVMIVVNQLQTRIDTIKTAINGYQNDVLPKLQRIVDEAQNDEEANKIANEEFIIENNK